MLHIQASQLSSLSNIRQGDQWNTINSTLNLTSNHKLKNSMHSNIWSQPSMYSKVKQVSSIAIIIMTYVPQENESYSDRRGENQLIVADTNRHYVCSFIGWWSGAMEFDFMGLMAAHMGFVVNYPIITKNKWLPTADIIVIFGKRSEQLFCCRYKRDTYMCIVIDPCTYCCACHCNAHCISAVNKKTVWFQCNSGRLLIAFVRSWCVIVQCSLCVSLYLSVFISFCFNILWYFVWMQSLASCSNPFRYGHSRIINKHTSGQS